ncbi:MAG: transporter [Bacteroidia bacterium]|nr:MAG: transporter [Bacteroidia bacterium]
MMGGNGDYSMCTIPNTCTILAYKPFEHIKKFSVHLPSPMAMKEKIYTLIIALICQVSIFISQNNSLNLQQCIDIALQNSLNLKISDVNLKTAKNNALQSQAQTLPSLNAGANHIYQYGRTIDRYTNSFANTQVLSQNFYLTAQWTIWAGLSQYHTIQANKMNYLSAQENLAQQKNDLILNVATAYINVILSQDVLKINQSQYEITKQQFERTKILVDQGSATLSNLKDIEAQLANDELNVINSKNNLELNLLALKQILNLPPQQNIEIVRPDISINTDILNQYTADDIYNIALKTQPSVKSREYQLKANEYILKANRGRRSPTLNISASLATGYSGLAQRIIGYQTQIDTFATIPGYGPLVFSQQVPILEKTPFIQQYKDNFNQTLGFNLTIPLFNGLSTHTSIQNAKLNVLTAKYNFDLNNQNLYKTIVQAYANAKAALQKYEASLKSYDAAKLSFEMNENKYQQGALSYFDYTTARNRKVNAELNLIQAKYDLFFKLKILEFYAGKPLNF